MTPARYLCIGTHHKTGTVWMRRVLHAIMADQEIPIVQCYRPQGMAKLRQQGPQFVVNWASTFPFLMYELETARFFHVIRDPRDVLVSGMRFHRIAPLGNEKFLQEPRPGTDGRSYQAHLNHLPNDEARLIFEMENKHDETVKEMLRWPYGHPRTFDVKYEELIEDTECRLFRTALEGFAIEGLDIDRAVRTYWEQSLFGGLSEQTMDARQRKHVAKGSGGQWRTELPPSVARLYADRYGPALKRLGYAEDDSWLDEIDYRPGPDRATVRAAGVIPAPSARSLPAPDC